jgi:hypothetical protein
MQIGISIMLAYSVFSLRLSEDVPSQSDSVHLISLYLTICMFFSLSAMTWFAIANKLREKKRLPYWLRWLALDYISWIVCATNMRRKARRAAKQELKPSPMTSVIIPLQQSTTTNSMESPNHCYTDRESIPTTVSLLPSKSQQSLRPSTATIQCGTSPDSETRISPSTVWVRQSVRKTRSSSANGPNNTKTTNSSKTPRDPALRKNQESLYAIHIINRLVFLMFLLTVIIINIYTWFIYSRTVKTKLHDNQTVWTCFDESRLEVVNCNDTL